MLCCVLFNVGLWVKYICTAYLQELDILETERVLEGSLDCWVLLTCLEVRHLLHRKKLVEL